jgi:low affinity Fe/Cu permease
VAVRKEGQNGKGAFRVMAERASMMIGSPTAFAASIALVGVWALSGFVLHFSTDWQLIINTVTNIVTLFIVFLIQNTQNRDAKAMHLKLDELIRAVGEARTHMVGLENLPDEDLARLERQFQRIHEREVRKQEVKAEQKTSGAGG